MVSDQIALCANFPYMWQHMGNGTSIQDPRESKRTGPWSKRDASIPPATLLCAATYSEGKYIFEPFEGDNRRSRDQKAPTSTEETLLQLSHCLSTVSSMRRQFPGSDGDMFFDIGPSIVKTEGDESIPPGDQSWFMYSRGIECMNSKGE